MKYNNNLTITNPRSLSHFSLNNFFDDISELTKMTSKCTSAETLCATANKHDKYHQKWEVDKDSKNETRLICKDSFGNTYYLIAHKEKEESDMINKKDLRKLFQDAADTDQDELDLYSQLIFLYPATGSKKGIFDLTEILDYYLYDMKLTKRTVQLVTENSKQVYWMWVPKILKMEDIYNILEFENKNLKEYGGYKICGDAENSKDTDILSDERIHALINHVAKKYKWESSPEEYDVIFKL